jgi:hypothetical protein
MKGRQNFLVVEKSDSHIDSQVMYIVFPSLLDQELDVR